MSADDDRDRLGPTPGHDEVVGNAAHAPHQEPARHRRRQATRFLPVLIDRARISVTDHFSALSAMAVRCGGVAAAFILTALIGRWYGPVANAQYALVTQTALFLSMIAVGGADIALTREFSRAVAEGKKLARGNLWLVMARTCGAAFFICLVVLIGGHRLMVMIGRATLPEGALLVMCLLVLSRAFTRIGAAVLRSQRDYVLSQAIELFMIPVITIILIAMGFARTLPGFLWATAAAGLLTALTGIALMERHTTTHHGISVDFRQVSRVALPLWGVAVISGFADWFGLTTVSAVNGLYSAGLYRVAVQFASAFAIISYGLLSTFSAQISAALHANDLDRVGYLCRSATRLSAAIVIPAVAVTSFFAPQLLSLVGPEFREGATMLRILAIGHAVYAVTGISGLALAILGRPAYNFYVNLARIIVIVIGAPIAAHLAGPTALCMYLSVSMAASNVAELIIVKRFIGLNVLTGHRRRGDI